MTKKEQIEEIRRLIYHVRSQVNGIATAGDIAEALYNAGYRKNIEMKEYKYNFGDEVTIDYGELKGIHSTIIYRENGDNYLEPLYKVSCSKLLIPQSCLKLYKSRMSIIECKPGDIVYYTLNNRRIYDMIDSITCDEHGQNIHVNLILTQYVSTFNYKKFEYSKGDYINLGKQNFKIDYFIIMKRKIYIVTDKGIYIPIDIAIAFYTSQEYKAEMDHLRAMKLALNGVYGIHRFGQPKLSMTNLAKVVYKLKNEELEKAFEAVCKDANITTSTKQKTKIYKYINDECVYEEVK